MNKTLAHLALVVVLAGCEAPTDVASSARTSGGSFDLVTTKSVLLIKQFPSAVVAVSDLSNGLASLKDTNSEPSKWVISFDISSLRGVSVRDVNLTLYYDGKAPAANHVSALGNLRLYKGAGDMNPGSSYWNESLSEVSVLINSDATLNGLVNKSEFSVDVSDALNASIALGESTVSFVVKWDTEVNGTNHNVNFYCSYGSSVLAQYVPKLSGNF